MQVYLALSDVLAKLGKDARLPTRRGIKSPFSNSLNPRGWISSRGSSASSAPPAPYRPPSPPAPGQWRLSNHNAGLARIAPLKTVPHSWKYLTNYLTLARCLQECGSLRKRQNMGQTSEDGLQHSTKGEKAAEMKLMRFYKSEQCSLTRDLPVYS